MFALCQNWESNLNVPENDFHFVFDCPKYHNIRRKTFGDIFERDNQILFFKSNFFSRFLEISKN